VLTANIHNRVMGDSCGMLLPSEIEARWLLPLLRALIVRRLLNEYHLTQEKVARLLGITQASVSNYVRAVRAKGLRPEMVSLLARYASDVADVAYRSQDPQTVAKTIQEALIRIRKDRVLCELHQLLEPGFDVENCELCQLN
jgi:Predicted transcriptional regulator